MVWKCPDCVSPFPFQNDDHDCAGAPDFLIGGEVPNGSGDKNLDFAPALSQPLPIREAIFYAYDFLLAAKQSRGGPRSRISRRSIRKAIRAYYAVDKFKHPYAKIFELDIHMHAGRVGVRLLNQALGTKHELPGKWGGSDGTNEKISALESWIIKLARDEGIDPRTGQPVL